MIIDAQTEARELRHDYLGVEHILLGLLRAHDGAAAQILGSLGVSFEGVRARLLEIGAQGGAPPPEGQVPFTPRAKRVLEHALREALSLGQNDISPEIILLALAGENEGVAMRILGEGGVSADQLRSAILETLPAPRPVAAEARRRVAMTDPGIRVGHSQEVLRLLMAAGAEALDDGRTDIQIHDLLVALTREPTAARLLAALGVDEEAIRAAIERENGSEQPPDASATG